jgi:hypothetical protein
MNTCSNPQQGVENTTRWERMMGVDDEDGFDDGSQASFS